MDNLEEFFGLMKHKILTCKRCGKSWIRKSMKKLPHNCAICNSPYWQRERKIN